MNSKNFDEQKFRILVDRWNEGPRLDFKEMIYAYKPDDQQLEFARDLIAFANVARRIGKPCWILFGVKDDTRELVSVKDQFPGKNFPKGFKNPRVSIHSIQSEIEGQFCSFAKSWIDPEIPEFSWDYGEIDGVFVAYITIEPTMSVEPYQLSKIGKKNNHTYKKGTVFIRQNSSTVEVARAQVARLLTRSEAAYLDKEDWKLLINSHKISDFSRMKELQPYIDHHFVQFPTENSIDILSSHLDQGEKNIIVEGKRGEGKTVLLHRLAYSLASKHGELDSINDQFGFSANKYYEDSIIRNIFDLEVIPSYPIPIFMSLRTFFSPNEGVESDLFKLICNYIGWSTDKSNNLKGLFNIPGTRWVLLLDALDELRLPNISGPILRKWIEQLPNNVQVILTTRPYSGIPFKEGTKFSLLPLSKDEVFYVFQNRLIRFISQRENLPETQIDVHGPIDWLIQNFMELEYLVMNFRALDGAVAIFTSSLPEKVETDYEIIGVEKTIPYINLSGVHHSYETQVFPLISKEEILSIDESTNDPIPFQSDLLQVSNESEILPESKISTETEIIPETQIPTDNPIHEWVYPLVADAITRIVDFLQAEEIIRQQEIGEKIQQKASRSRSYLGCTAWKTDWDKEDFNYSICYENLWMSEYALDWCENIGYIYRYDPNRDLYKYMSHNFKDYMAAEYAYWRTLEDNGSLEDINVKDAIAKRLVTSHHANRILLFLNQLRESNGRKPIKLTL